MAEKSVYFVRKDGTRFGGARGVYEILKKLPGLWGLFGAVMAIPPLSISSEPFYRAFASNRHYVSRKMGLRECVIKTLDETPESSRE
jgi:predicted DCC family thiol-disulfide oxidoreductase YuxK